MTDAMKQAETFDVYFFAGIWLNKPKGKELKTLTLEECFTDVFSTSYDTNMKAFFERGYYFNVRKPDIDDIKRWIEQGCIIIPFSADVSKKDVQRYLKAGFDVVFMKVAEFRKMRKALEQLL